METFIPFVMIIEIIRIAVLDCFDERLDKLAKTRPDNNGKNNN